MDYNSWSLVGQVSVCLYAPSTAENLHAPSTAVLTLHLNTVLSCNWTAYRYRLCVLFRWSASATLIDIAETQGGDPKTQHEVDEEWLPL